MIRVWGYWRRAKRCCERGGRERSADRSEFRSKFSPQPVTISISFLYSGHGITLSSSQIFCSLFGIYYSTLSELLFSFSSVTYLGTLVFAICRRFASKVFPSSFGAPSLMEAVYNYSARCRIVLLCAYNWYFASKMLWVGPSLCWHPLLTSMVLQLWLLCYPMLPIAYPGSRNMVEHTPGDPEAWLGLYLSWWVTLP